MKFYLNNDCAFFYIVHVAKKEESIHNISENPKENKLVQISFHKMRKQRNSCLTMLNKNAKKT